MKIKIKLPKKISKKKIDMSFLDGDLVKLLLFTIAGSCIVGYTYKLMGGDFWLAVTIQIPITVAVLLFLKNDYRGV